MPTLEATTADELVADIQDWTSMSSAVISSTVALKCVNRALRRLKRKHAWRAQQRSIDITFNAGLEQAQVLPADFVSEVLVSVKTAPTNQNPDPTGNLTPALRTLRSLWYVASGNAAAARDPTFPSVALPGATAASGSNQQGYMIWAGTLTLVPGVTSSTLVQVDYVADTRDVVLGLTPADTNELIGRYSDVILDGALARAYRYLHEWDAATQHEASFVQGLEEAMRLDNALVSGGLPQSRGK